ncbi:NFACT family protein [Candidatus Woesearchaeota archaeon]|nr:NFACT family protein [Candidatus Woesearchaeota archaeon]
MKKELSSVELKYLTDEFQQLIGSKVDKIYQPAKKELLFSFHVPGIGKKMLRIVLPGLIWLTEVKPAMPEKIHGFCALLRKYLTNARVRKIEQAGSERILEFQLETKKGEYSLIIELFGKGNILLCQKGKIILPLSLQKWKDRIIKKGENYTFPSREHNPFKITAAKFKNLIDSSKETISKTLAVELGIGGVYAAEVCLRAGINKTAKKITEQEIKKIYKTMNSLLQQKIEPVVVFENNKAIDITPFKLEFYAKKRQELFKTYSQAFDSVLAKGLEKKELTQVKDKFAGRLERIEKRIKMQEENLKKQEKAAKDSQAKGEKIYEKYSELKKLFSEIKKMRKTMSWKEIKAKLKSVKYIKQINEKTGEILIELNKR